MVGAYFRSWQVYRVVSSSHYRRTGIVAQTALLPFTSTSCLIRIALLSCCSTLKYQRLNITVNGHLSFDFTGFSCDICDGCMYVLLDILQSVKEERNILIRT